MSIKREFTSEKWLQMKAAAPVGSVVLAPKSCARWLTEQLPGVAIF